jgi:D-sedoheptulose 7-phosphate isomerase
MRLLEPGTAGSMAGPVARAEQHCAVLTECISRIRQEQLALLARWAEALADLLPAGGRLLAAGNGGSAAQAQHLTAELVGRYDGERPAYSALALNAETSSLTAIGNDYGYDEVFARQVAAHGRPGDVLVAMSTSGRSPNLVRAVEAARAGRLRVWAMTGRRPNPLADLADEVLDIDAPHTATVQEAHLLALHVLCELFDDARLERWGPRQRERDGRWSSDVRTTPEEARS